MIEKPDYVKAFQKPVKTEIKHIGGGWYLYECSSKYDPAIKRSRKISGKCLGVITPQGLVKTMRRLRPVGEAAAKSVVIDDVLHVGGPIFFWQRTAQLRERLRRHFPDLWKAIYATVLLRTEWEPTFKRLPMHFESSLLAGMFPDLSFGPAENAALLRNLGKHRQAMSDFMKEDIADKSVFILFDGHRLISSSETMEFAELGYDSKRRFMPQINLMYVFSLDDTVGTPIYYKQFIGSTPDVSAFSDVLKESGIANSTCTIVADKGFASDADFELLDERNLQYIIPIRRGNAVTKSMLPLQHTSFEDVFSYNGRAIQAHKIAKDDFNVFVYFDAQLYANELADSVLRGEKDNNTRQKKIDTEMTRRSKGKGKLTQEELDELQPKNLAKLQEEIPEMGTVTIRTNRKELNSTQVYQIYKRRQDIEQFFKTYGDSLDFEASYMRSKTTQEAWLFLNHLSAMIGMDCLNSISMAGCEKEVSLNDVREMLRKITAYKIDGKWQIAPIKNKVGKLLEKLNTTMTNEELASILDTCSSLRSIP